MSTLLKLLKIILISFFSFNLISSEKQNYECDLGFESIVDKNICIKNLKNNKDRKIGLMNLENISRVTIALNADIYAAPVLCIAANAQTAKRPTSHGVESDNRLINCGTRVLSFALSMNPLSMRRFPPIP